MASHAEDTYRLALEIQMRALAEINKLLRHPKLDQLAIEEIGIIACDDNNAGIVNLCRARDEELRRGEDDIVNRGAR